MSRKLLNPNESAKYLGFNCSTFLHFIKFARIPEGIKLGPQAIRWRLMNTLTVAPRNPPLPETRKARLTREPNC